MHQFVNIYWSFFWKKSEYQFPYKVVNLEDCIKLHFYPISMTRFSRKPSCSSLKAKNCTFLSLSASANFTGWLKSFLFFMNYSLRRFLVGRTVIALISFSVSFAVVELYGRSFNVRASGSAYAYVITIYIQIILSNLITIFYNIPSMIKNAIHSLQHAEIH